ncbi:MAG: ureidoglycolate lyase [Candidatus Obscuribacterales bacterium]|nr:ureidoglycolate lyase [Candidatus Obscuribacterales bacterium]
MSAPDSILAEPINREKYQPYGDLIAADEVLPFNFANMKTARRFNRLADVINLRPDRATLNLCVFRCDPLASLPLVMKLLERHEFSTQVFLPISSAARFLVAVSLGGDEPDLSTLKVFEVTNPQGISYRPGVWHYPMTAIEHQVDFACLVHEDGSKDDCEIHALAKPMRVMCSK